MTAKLCIQVRQCGTAQTLATEAGWRWYGQLERAAEVQGFKPKALQYSEVVYYCGCAELGMVWSVRVRSSILFTETYLDAGILKY